MSAPGSTPSVHYVSVLIFTIKPDDFASFSDTLTLFVKRRGPTLGGMVEAIILGDDDKTRVVVVSQWDSRDSWSAAQWEEDVARSLADLVEAAISFEVHSYEPIAVVRSESRAF